MTCCPSSSFRSRSFLNSLLISSLIHRCLEVCYLLCNIWGFPKFLFAVISNLVPLWSENIFCMVATLLYLLRLVLQPSIWENVPCALEKTVFSCCCWVEGWINANQVKWVDSVVQVFYIHTDLSSCSNCYWKWSLEISSCDGWIYFFSFQFWQFCFMYIGAVFLGAYTFVLVMSSWRIDPSYPSA